MAVRVPIMSPEITPQATPSMPTPEIMRPPPEAFGGASAEARQKLGDQEQQTGDVVFQRMMEHRDREMNQQNLDIMTQTQTHIMDILKNPELDDNQMPKGFLNRQMNLAKGATADYDQKFTALKQGVLSDGSLSPIQKMDLNRMITASGIAGREAVVSHEAEETQKAHAASLQSGIQSTVAMASNITDAKVLGRLADESTKPGSPIDKGWDNAGTDPKLKPAMKAGFTDELIKSALVPLNENNPDAAQKLFDGVKDRLTNQAANELQNTITGKKMDQTALQAWSWADQNARRGPDGTIDRAVLDEHIRSMNLPPNIEMHVMTMADRRSSVDGSEIMKNKAENEKDFMNKLTVGVSSGKLQYPDAIRLAYSTGGSPVEIAAREKTVTQAFTHNEMAFPMWLSKQNDEVRGAVESSKQQIEAAYPSKLQSIMKQGATTELERQWLGKSAAQIRQTTSDMLKTVVTQKNPWYMPDKKDTAWKVSAGERAQFDAARDRVTQDGQAPTEANIRAAMEYMASQEKK